MKDVNYQTLSVFVSYSHDSPTHLKKVLDFADRLREDGIDCNLDQYEQAPSEGWPRWMEKCIRKAKFVLVVCTERYDKCAKGDESYSYGKGVSFETLLTYEEIKDNYAKNSKYIPVLFNKKDVAFIPKLLRPFEYYLINSDEGYEKLYRRITQQPLIAKPPKGSIKILEKGLNIKAKMARKKVSNSMEESINTFTQTENTEDDLYAKGISQVEIELKINRDFDKFTEEDQKSLLEAIKVLLNIEGGVRIIRIRNGSVLVYLNMSPELANKLRMFVKAGQLEEYGVTEARIIDEEDSKDAVKIKNEPKSPNIEPAIFICHANEDKNYAMKLYEKLQNAGFKPWMDKRNIRVGEDWDKSVEKAIQKIDYFIVLQSRAMNQKIEGYLYDEIHIALKRQDKFKEGMTFIIPVKIEDCEVLEELKHLHTIDLLNHKIIDELIGTIVEDYQKWRKG